MPQEYPDAGNPGNITIYGQPVTFPFGANPAVGGSGPGGGSDTTELDPDEPPPDPPPCNDLSEMSDEDKIRYLVEYLAQRIADMMRNQPVQNREWGSAIYVTPHRRLRVHFPDPHVRPSGAN